MNCLLSMNKSARRCVFCSVSKTISPLLTMVKHDKLDSALWCENVRRTHIISLVFEYVQLRLINV